MPKNMDGFEQERETKINNLVGALLEREPLLEHYSRWLESIEGIGVKKGEDVVHTLMGAMQALSSGDFIPGTGMENFVEAIYRVQKKTGLDLGLCEGLTPCNERTPQCGRNPNVLISNYNCCIPPLRSNCPYRGK